MTRMRFSASTGVWTDSADLSAQHRVREVVQGGRPTDQYRLATEANGLHEQFTQLVFCFVDCGGEGFHVG
jgi:hypothetical protein